MKTLFQEHREEQLEARVKRAENGLLWAIAENERRQRCFGIVTLVMLAIVVIGILVVINVNK